MVQIDDFNVIRGKMEYSDAHDMLLKYMLRLPEHRFQRRIERNARIRSADDWERVRNEIREAFLEAIGGLPEERTPLKAHTIRVINREDYLVENLIFESLPNFHVTANLYVPKTRNGKVPGILFPIGHWYSGKIALTDRYAAAILAKRGYAVLIYDTIGQGERYQALNPYAKPYSDLPFDPELSIVKGRPNTFEHCLVGNQCFLSGLNLARFVVWDGMRALDYLQSRSEVNSELIGCTGCSGGGTYTSYLAALDDRVKVAVPVCAVSSIAGEWNSSDSWSDTGDAEQVLINAIPNFLDHGDLLMMAFPKPVLIIREAKDFVRMDTRVAYYEALSLYQKLGYGDRMCLLEVDAPHGYFKEMREPMYQWMDRWLLGVKEECEEPEISPIDEKLLACTQSGQVLTEFDGRSIRDLVDQYVSQKRTKKEAPEPDKLEQFNFQLKRDVTELLSLKCNLPVQAKVFSEFDAHGYLVERILISTETNIYIPALFFKSSSSWKPTILYVNTLGKASDAYRNGPIFRLLDSGFHVLSIDVRGTGETEPTTLHWQNRLKNRYDETGGYAAFLEGFKAILSYKALKIGRPVFSMQLTDVLGAFEYLLERDDVNKDKVSLIGRQSGGMLALHAGLLEPRISNVIASDFLISYRSIIRNYLYSWNFYDLIPGVLQRYDLDEIAASIAPRKLMMTNVSDHMKTRASLEAVNNAYNLTRQIYKMLGVAEKFKIAETPDEKTLADTWLNFVT